MDARKKGRHRKPSKTSKTLTRLAVIGAGFTIPISFGVGSANAASIGQWDSIARCEAGGDWSINHSGDGLSVGGLQFQNPSWHDALAELRRQGYDTSGYPSNLYQGMPRDQVPTKEQQILAGEALLHIQGPGAWVCNAIQGYPLHSGDSMFDGGTNPYPGGSGQSDTAPDPKPTPKPDPTPAKPNADGTYTVRAGDYLFKIAKEQLGDGEKWHDLYALNKDVIGGNPDEIEIGMVLKLHGTVSSSDETPAPSSTPKTHTVVSGDTLYDISIANGIGDGGLDTWKPLYEANKDVVGDDPDLIFPGQVLTLPGTSAPAPVEKPATPAPSTPSNDSTDTPKTTPKPSGWSAPINAHVTQVFHNPGSYGTGWHTGVDFSAPSGTHVMAVSHATVVHVGYGGAGAPYGNHIVLKLSDGKYVLYGHLSSTNVQDGQAVEAGEWIGNVGTTGNSTGPHLHFELRNSAFQYGASVFSDPVAYLAAHGVRL